MVVGILCWMVFLQIIFYSSCQAVSCFNLQLNGTGFLMKKNTCEGDVCVYYQPGPDSIFMEEKSCATGFDLPLGCRTSYYDESVMCICNTDFCNTGRIDELLILPEYNCYVQNSPNLHNGTGNGTKCVFSYGIEVTYGRDYYVGTKNGHESYPLPTGEPNLNQFSFYSGIVHSFVLRNGTDQKLLYDCTGDLCNSINRTTLSFDENITCYDDEVRVPEEATCHGEFCVFAVDSDRNQSYRYCMSTLNVQSNHTYKAGIYKYKTATYYLCREYGCNYNETIANETIGRLWRPEDLPEKIAVAGSFKLTPELIFVALSTLSACSFVAVLMVVINTEQMRFIEEEESDDC